jgi:TetR/AcrR family transcriptional repressor of mexJK operon
MSISAPVALPSATKRKRLKRGLPSRRSARPARSSRAGRPTAARVEAIERAILSAARRQFLATGFEATRMEVIAATARISKGTLYARYATKEKLLRAVVNQQCAAWADQARRKQGPAPVDFKQRMKHRARSIMESINSEDIRGFERLVGGTTLASGEFARALFEAGYQRGVNEIAEDIVASTRDGRDRPRNPQKVAEMLIGMLSGWYRAHVFVRDIPLAEALAYADHVVEVLFAGQSAW